MNKKATFNSHIISLNALFILGNGALIYPLYSANQFNFIAFLISAFALALIYLTASFLWNKVNVSQSTGVFLKGLYVALVSTLAVFSLFVAKESFADLTAFVSAIILPDTPKFYISLLLAVTVLYFAFKKSENLLKFSLVSTVLAAAVVFFFFMASTDKFDLRNIFIFRLPKFGEIIPQARAYLVNPALHCLVLPLFLKLNCIGNKTKQGLLGVLMGAVLLGICIVTPILLFGADVSGNLEFPFSSAVSTVTVGRLFTRLDGFAYFVYFVSAVVKITVCIKTAFSGLKKISLLIDKRQK